MEDGYQKVRIFNTIKYESNWFQCKLSRISCIDHEFSINISHRIDFLFNTSIQVLKLSPAQTWEECTAYFRVDEERGLSPSQVEEHKKKYGPNGEFLQSIDKMLSQSWG